MTKKKMDWEVITGWEKRIKVDFGSIGPNHVRWSHWTYKERDIVARKVHESASISRDHGSRSRRMEEWAKENAPIMIDFARDHKPMPDWAHADYRPSGIPEHVQIKWSQPDIAGKGDWAYDPPHPWEDGEEPAWSAKPMETDSEDGAEVGEFRWITVGELRWVDTDTLILPVDINGYPDDMDELLCAAKSRDESRGGWVTCRCRSASGSGANYVETVREACQIDFIVPLSYYIQAQGEDDPEFRLCFRKSNERTPPTYIYANRKCPPIVSNKRSVSEIVPEPQASFLSYAIEDFRPMAHQVKWARVLLATGYAWEGYCGKQMETVFRTAEREGAMDYKECLEFWERHGRNERWTKAKEWFEGRGQRTKEDLKKEFKARRDRAEELRKYRDAPPTQGNFTAEEWRQRYGVDPEVALVTGWGKYIIDPQTRQPLWGLDGDFPARHCWRYDKETDEWIDLDAETVGEVDAPHDWELNVPDEMAAAIAACDWDEVARIAKEMRDSK